MSMVRLKNGKSKLIIDETDLRELIKNELGYDAEDEFILILEKTESTKKYYDALCKEMDILEKENLDWENANLSLQDEVDKLEDEIKKLKNIIKELNKNNEMEE